MSNIWPYLAGIVDGEGTLCLNYRPTYVGKNIGAVCFSQIVIYNTSTTLMRWLIANVGGRFYLRTKTSLSKKPQYAWVPSGKKNREQFLLGVLPYLVIKKKQAELLLEFDRLGYGSADKRKELADRCSALNHLEESVETNTSGNPERGLKIESGLTSDCESGPVVIQVVEPQTLPVG